MKSVLLKELKYFLNTPSIYFIIGIFLTICSLSFWVFPEPAPNIFDYGLANLSTFFEFSPWLILLLAPIITMGIISEEKKEKTIELLLTKPIYELELVLGKFLASLILIIITFFPTIIYVFCIQELSSNDIDTGQIFSGYIGLILISSCFISIGIFFSSLTNKQLVAFILSFSTILFFLLGITLIQKMTSFDFLSVLNFNDRFEGFQKGIIDLKDVIFFISISLMFLLLTTEKLKRER